MKIGSSPSKTILIFFFIARPGFQPDFRHLNHGLHG
jgi:hypothetical protein